MMPKILFMIFVIFSMGAACTHDVYIRSNPNGAKIYVNDELIGTSPTIYEEKIGSRESVEIKAEKEGYKTQRLQLAKSGWAIPQVIASVGGCVCGGLCCGGVLSDVVGEEIGPLALLGGLPALSGIYFARKSDDNVYLKLSKEETPKAPPFKTKIPLQKGKTEKNATSKEEDVSEPQNNNGTLRPLPSGYTY